MCVVQRASRIIASAKWAATASASDNRKRSWGNSSPQRRRTAFCHVIPRTLPPMLRATTTGASCSCAQARIAVVVVCDAAGDHDARRVEAGGDRGDGVDLPGVHLPSAPWPACGT